MKCQNGTYCRKTFEQFGHAILDWFFFSGKKKKAGLGLNKGNLFQLFYAVRVGFGSSVNDEVNDISSNCEAFTGITVLFQILVQFYMI